VFLNQSYTWTERTLDPYEFVFETTSCDIGDFSGAIFVLCGGIDTERQKRVGRFTARAQKKVEAYTRGELA
jgi:hypothetical protein